RYWVGAVKWRESVRYSASSEASVPQCSRGHS
ncbi:MAG: hypothetical protein ACI9X4_002756, partial [Glaciecola sp.]